MAKKWVMVRVSEETHARLNRERERMETDQDGMYPFSELHGIISMDTVLIRLLDYRNGQRVRAAKSRAKRVKTARANGAGVVEQYEIAAGVVP